MRRKMSGRIPVEGGELSVELCMHRHWGLEARGTENTGPCGQVLNLREASCAGALCPGAAANLMLPSRGNYRETFLEWSLSV